MSRIYGKFSTNKYKQDPIDSKTCVLNMQPLNDNSNYDFNKSSLALIQTWQLNAAMVQVLIHNLDRLEYCDKISAVCKPWTVCWLLEIDYVRTVLFI